MNNITGMLTNEDIEKAKALLELITERKRSYKIVDTNIQPYQQKLIDAMSELNGEGNSVKNKYVLFQWWNWAWKTFIALYIAILMWMWRLCEKYNLPYIGTKRDIFIWTQSGDTLKNNILKYIMDDFSKLRIPPELIKHVTKDNGWVKKIELINGASIKFYTYEQGQKTLQGTNGDLYVCDEEPTDPDVFKELIMRVREWNSQILFSFTPLHGYTSAYTWFYEQDSDKIKNRSYVQVANARQNKTVENLALDWLTWEDRKMREEGLFTPPSWLVYPIFNRLTHTIPFFNPHDLGNIVFYAGLDFWVSHPTAMPAIAVDEDGNMYIFDLIYESNMWLEELANRIKGIEKEYKMEFEYIIADSAGKRERLELKKYGINTVWADKWTKSESGDSNRRASIMKVNQLLADEKLYIADHLKEAIREFESHHYIENNKDWAVDKKNDDFLDALRYFIFAYKPPKHTTRREAELERKYNKIKSNFNKPY